MFVRCEADVLLKGIPFGFMDLDLKTGTMRVWDGGDTRFSTANMDDIGAGVASLVTDPKMRADNLNQTVYISSHQVTQNEILAAVEEVTGEKLKVEHVDSGPALANPSDFAGMLKAIQFSRRGLADFEKTVAQGRGKFLVNRRRDVREVLRQVVSKQ